MNPTAGHATAVRRRCDHQKHQRPCLELCWANEIANEDRTRGWLSPCRRDDAVSRPMPMLLLAVPLPLSSPPRDTRPSWKMIQSMREFPKINAG